MRGSIKNLRARKKNNQKQQMDLPKNVIMYIYLFFGLKYIF